MRFINEKKPWPGDQREYTRFAWLPVTIGRETRWLETVTTLQFFSATTGHPRGWVDEGFCEKGSFCQ